jgi:hypothetical protein
MVTGDRALCLPRPAGLLRPAPAPRIPAAADSRPRQPPARPARAGGQP